MEYIKGHLCGALERFDIKTVVLVDMVDLFLFVPKNLSEYLLLFFMKDINQSHEIHQYHVIIITMIK